MKKLLQISVSVGLAFALSCQSPHYVENGQEISERFLANGVQLPENLGETQDYYISQAKILHEQQFSKESFWSFTESYKKLTGEELKMSHKEFLKSRSKALNEFKNSKQPDKYISQVFSEKGIKTIENIRDILNSAESPEEASAKFVECEQIIDTDAFLSKNEKSLLRFQLGFVKAMSIEAAKAKSGKNLRQAAAATSCQWYQWGCVFYFSTAGFSYVFLFYFANPHLWPIISSLGGDISYIAKCCFCGCDCDTPCPPTFPFLIFD